jgi:hypothetical protein
LKEGHIKRNQKLIPKDMGIPQTGKKNLSELERNCHQKKKSLPEAFPGMLAQRLGKKNYG